MAARFKGDVKGGTAGLPTGLLKGHDFRMVTTGRLSITLSNNDIVFNQHCSHCRVGTDLSLR